VELKALFFKTLYYWTAAYVCLYVSSFQFPVFMIFFIFFLVSCFSMNFDNLCIRIKSRVSHAWFFILHIPCYLLKFTD